MPSPFEMARVSNLNLRVLEQASAVIRAYDDKAHCLAMLKHENKPSDIYAEWTADTPPTPMDGSVPEGQDKTDGYGSYQAAKLRNHSQEKRSSGKRISVRAQNVKQKDVASEVAKQRVRDAEEITMDWECTVMSAVDADDGTGNDQGITKTRGMANWLTPVAGTSLYGNGTYSQRAIDPIPASVAVQPGQFFDGALGNGTTTGFTESVFATMLGACASQVKGPVNLTGHVGMTLKRQMTGWALSATSTVGSNQIATRIAMLDALTKKLVQMVDFFQYDGGSVTSILSFWVARALADKVWVPGMGDASGLFIMPKYWGMNWLNPIEFIDQNKGNSKVGGPRFVHYSDGMLRPGTVQGQMAVLPVSL